MNISVAIMAHPKRKTNAVALYDQLRAYPFVDVEIIWDQVNDEWHTGRRALASGIVVGNDWHVVIQDDAILTPCFYENLIGAIAALHEKTLISLYTGTARPLRERVASAVERAANGSYLEFRQLLWGVGIIIPTSHILPMLEFVEDIKLQYDNKIGEFYCRQGLPVYYTVPSLVDHNDDLDSLVPGHGRAISADKRIAHRPAIDKVSWKNHKTYI